MLEGVLKGDLKLNKTINKYLDLCLKCGKCKNFCPSGIDACKIFESAKYEYSKQTLEGKIIRFLESKYVFGAFLKLFNKIDQNRPTETEKNLKVLYFKGCVNKVYPKVEQALKKVLSNYDVELIERDFECCGLPFLSSGNLERFEEVKKHNLAEFHGDFDYILTDCASCEATLKSYFDESEQMPKAKIINIADFLVKHPRKFVFKKTVRVTFHKPCHLENINFLTKIFDMCENVEYVEMHGIDDCCGFAGEFAVKNNKLSRSIGAKKAQNIIDTQADYVLTLCPACVMGLHQGFAANGNFKHPQIKNLIEFLALAEIQG